MRWSKIKRQHPNKFILLGDIIEERITEREYRVLGGKVLKVSDNAKEIRTIYKAYKKQGMNVLYSLPSTPIEFIVENVPFRGIIK
ncbi:conserved hypothetical protein [Candidatus Magnetomoraceae bacterium gMMP-15]